MGLLQNFTVERKIHLNVALDVKSIRVSDLSALPIDTNNKICKKISRSKLQYLNILSTDMDGLNIQEHESYPSGSAEPNLR